MTRERWISIGLVAALIVSIAPLVILRGAGSSMLAKTIQNIGHLPLFAWLTTLLWVLAARWLGTRVWIAGQYAGVFGVAIGLSVLTELVQLLGPRDADLTDLLSNTVGALAALVLLATCDRRLDGMRVRSNPFRTLLRVAVTIVLVISLVPLVSTVQAYRERERRMPTLWDYSSSWEKGFLATNKNAWYEFAAPPESWVNAPPPTALRLSFSDLIGGVLVFLEPFPDWSGYEALEFDIFHPGTGRIELGFRVEDQIGHLSHNDRFNRHLFLKPGLNRISIPMKDIEEAPAERLLDLTRMRAIVMFAVEPTGSYVIYLGPIRLSGGDGKATSAAPSPG